MDVIRARPLLGTLVHIHAAGPPRRIQGAIDAGFAAVEQVQRLMSVHDPDSDLSRLNRHGATRPWRVQADTYAVLAAALRFARLSDGAFDPCVGGTLERWGLLPRHGEPVPGRCARPPDWRDIELLPDQQVRFRRSLRLDLGGIAKGHAVDVAVDTLRRNGAVRILVNAGGDLRHWGGQAAAIRLRDPRTPALLGEAACAVPVANAALATSAAYFSRCGHAGGDVSALVDPRTGRPYLEATSVSVRAPDCLSADALTKVVLFAAPAVAERALGRCRATAFVQRAARDASADVPDRRVDAR